jgi:hypothetical protein
MRRGKQGMVGEGAGSPTSDEGAGGPTSDEAWRVTA